MSEKTYAARVLAHQPALVRLTPNATIIVFSDGTEVLYSYAVPVAARGGRHPDRFAVRTAEVYSRTTSTHIGRFCRGMRPVPQRIIDALANGMRWDDLRDEAVS